MPQLYSQSMYGSYFSPNPGINKPHSRFEDFGKSRNSELFYVQANDSYEDLHPSKVSGAKSNTSFMESSGTDSSLSFQFESSPATQSSPVIYTPQKDTSNLENFPYQNQNWSPDINQAVRRSPITASRLSFNEAYSPSNTTIDGSIRESSFWEDGEMGFGANQSFQSGQFANPGLGIVCNTDSNSTASENYKVNNPFGDERASHDVEVFLKEDPFAEAIQTEEWFSDTQQYDHQSQLPLKETRMEVTSYPRIVKTEKQSYQSKSPIIRREYLASNEKQAPATPRKLRKAKSLGFIGKNSSNTHFSLENCLNEFHVKEGKFSFQDETARVSKQSGTPSISRRKSIPKLAGSMHSLKKAKTSSSLCLRAGSRSNEGTSKDMESRLGLFKVQLKSASSTDVNKVFFPPDSGSSEVADFWSDFS